MWFNKSLLQLFLLSLSVFYPEYLIFAVSTSQIHCNCPYQSHWIQLKLFSDILLHHSAASPTCSHLDHCRCFLTLLPALNLPFSSLSFPLLQGNLSKYRYDHITPLSLKPFRGSTLPIGTDKSSITHMKPLMIWPPAFQSYVLLIPS